MRTNDIREKYLRFFAKRGHVRIKPSPLILENDPTTLFTSAGMQPLTPFLKGKKHPKGRRLVDSQPSLRLQDIEEVGDNRHTTFFEMLGNWSLGDYFKKEQLAWCLDFFVKELDLSKDKLYMTVFNGAKGVPKDIESFEIWKSLGISEKRIFFYGEDENWWSTHEIGGPDSEVFYEFGIPHDPRFGKVCHPNCNCGKFLEIGNSVFIQYLKEKDGTLAELPQKNVDFGGGLERISAAVNGDPDIFKIDVFVPLISKIEKEAGINYNADSKKDKSFRIIADHLRACCSLLAEGVIPGNKLHGYALRRLVRRAMFHFHILGSGISGAAISHVSESLRNSYPLIDENWKFIEENLSAEATRFELALKRGLAKLTAAVVKGEKIDGKFAFDLYQSEGFPLELTIEIIGQNGENFTSEERKSFADEFEKHKELSRTTSRGVFEGGLESKSDAIITRLHTATHLLHASLRKVLGEHVSQKGSHITFERLRFDFSHNQRLTDRKLEEVEALVNQKIKEDLPVSFAKKSLEEAISGGALHFFGEKYGKRVGVYSIGDFSKEICGGPHVKSTKEVGRVKIIKQESIGSGIIRIYAALK